jgi:hypothetical protein
MIRGLVLGRLKVHVGFVSKSRIWEGDRIRV